jgi:RimJ/RimL family protein N-acetyltransferase
MLIREAQPTDAKGIAEIHVRSWQTAYDGIIPDIVLTRLSIDEREFVWKKRLMAEQPSLTLVLIVESTLAGWASVGPARDADCDPISISELYGIYLAPEFWRSGFGTHLYQAIEKRTIDETREMIVWVLDENNRGRRFYEASGFILEPTQRKEEKFGSLALTEVRYRKRFAR